MINALILYENRIEEIDAYFAFLNKIGQRRVMIKIGDKEEEKIGIGTVQILRANAFILLYNLVESCIAQAIEDIYLAIKENQNSFDEVSLNLKTQILTHIKKNKDVKDLAENMLDDIAQNIMNHYPQRKQLFSGNVDAKKIKEIAKSYGFSVETDAQLTKNGADLVRIKSRRNDLAHGDISFKDCGKEVTIEDLNAIKTSTTIYLKEILNNIDHYIINKRYIRG